MRPCELELDGLVVDVEVRIVLVVPEVRAVLAGRHVFFAEERARHKGRGVCAVGRLDQGAARALRGGGRAVARRRPQSISQGAAHGELGLFGGLRLLGSEGRFGISSDRAALLERLGTESARSGQWRDGRAGRVSLSHAQVEARRLRGRARERAPQLLDGRGKVGGVSVVGG